MIVLVAIFAIVVVAAAVQGVTGFGFALVAMPLLQLVAEPHAAVVGSSLATLLLMVGVAVREREHVRWSAAVPLMAAAAVGMPIGLLALQRLSGTALSLLTALAALSCTALVWRDMRLPSGRGTVIGAGVLVGVLSTSTGTSGPPLVAAFKAMGYEPREFRATIAGMFGFTSVVSVAGFVATGQVSRAAIVLGSVALPATWVGWWAGNRLFRRIDTDRFRHFVLVALVVSCVLAIMRIVVT
jgi:uncharacterized membrane protein YfcA